MLNSLTAQALNIPFPDPEDLVQKNPLGNQKYLKSAFVLEQQTLYVCHKICP